MRYSLEDLQAVAVDALSGRSPEAYMKEGVPKLIQWLEAGDRDRWKLLGPYWPAAKEIIEEYEPASDVTQGWGDVPDYLSRYNYHADVLNLLACLMYLNRDGDYINADPSSPHSIEMPNGEAVLYVPGTGILEAK